MRVETGADQYQLRPEALKGRPPRRQNSLAKLRAARTGIQRHIDALIGHARRVGVRIQRVLIGRTQQHARVVAENVFGAVGVMYVEIQNCDAFESAYR
jgi:hypothetical protein